MVVDISKKEFKELHKKAVNNHCSDTIVLDAVYCGTDLSDEEYIRELKHLAGDN